LMPSPAVLRPSRLRELCKLTGGHDNAALNCSVLPQDGGATFVPDFRQERDAVLSRISVGVLREYHGGRR
jgi:hypothetical protein